MIIRSVRHRGLRLLLERDDAKHLDRRMEPRIRRVLAALISAVDMDGVHGPPGWRIHQLTGRRNGDWSISVSGNWRITFALRDGDIFDLDLEDYH